MKSATKGAVAATVLAMSGLICAPATAATQHCDSTTYPNKVEVGGDRKRVQTGLTEGTEVCIKAGTKTTIVEVDENGFITQSEITNKRGKALAISYYAYGEEEPEEPCVPAPYSPCP